MLKISIIFLLMLLGPLANIYAEDSQEVLFQLGREGIKEYTSFEDRWSHKGTGELQLPNNDGIRGLVEGLTKSGMNNYPALFVADRRYAFLPYYEGPGYRYMCLNEKIRDHIITSQNENRRLSIFSRYNMAFPSVTPDAQTAFALRPMDKQDCRMVLFKFDIKFAYDISKYSATPQILEVVPASPSYVIKNISNESNLMTVSLSDEGMPGLDVRLSIEEKLALQDYMSGAYLRVNSGGDQKLAEKISSTIKKFPRHEGMIYRGGCVSKDELINYNKSLNGEVVSGGNRFWSTSRFENVARRFIDYSMNKCGARAGEWFPVLYKISSKNGRDISLYSVTEDEVLLDRNSSFKATGIEEYIEQAWGRTVYVITLSEITP